MTKIIAILFGAALLFAVQTGIRLLRERRWARQQAKRAAPGPVELHCIHPFSLFINNRKVGTATENDVTLDRERTCLTVSMLLTNKRGAGADLRAAYEAGEPLSSVAIGLIDEDILRLRGMRVSSLRYRAQYKTGSSLLIATLEGPSIYLAKADSKEASAPAAQCGDGVGDCEPPAPINLS